MSEGQRQGDNSGCQREVNDSAQAVGHKLWRGHLYILYWVDSRLLGVEHTNSVSPSIREITLLHFYRFFS